MEGEKKMKESTNYLELANSPLMWLAAAVAVGVVVVQSVVFFRKSLKAAKELEISKEQVNMAIKSSAIASIGPAIVILVTMISLIVSMGAPVSWMRLSFIGSVNYEALESGSRSIFLRRMGYDMRFAWLAYFYTSVYRQDA